MTLETIEASPLSRLVLRIADPDLPFGGKWTYELQPSANGSRVTITEDGEVYNPIFRFMSHVFFSQSASIEIDGPCGSGWRGIPLELADTQSCRAHKPGNLSGGKVPRPSPPRVWRDLGFAQVVCLVGAEGGEGLVGGAVVVGGGGGDEAQLVAQLQ